MDTDLLGAAPASVTVATRDPLAGRIWAWIAMSAVWFGAMVVVPRLMTTPGEVPGASRIV